MQQRCHHRRIHTAGQSQQHFVIAHLCTHAGHHVFDDVAGIPQRCAAADFTHETLEQLTALLGVGHFRVELYAVETLVFVLHRRDRATGGFGDAVEAGGQLRHLVAVAHPHIQLVAAVVIVESVEQGGAIAGAHFGITEFAHGRGFHLAAQLHCHGLHAVADAQYRHPQFEHDGIGAVGVGLGDGFRSAGQDDAAGIEGLDVRRAGVAGPEFAVHADLAHAAGDQLGVLGAEVENQNAVGVDVGHGWIPVGSNLWSEKRGAGT